VIFQVFHSESTPNPYGGLPVRPEEMLTMFQDARSSLQKVLSSIPDSMVSVDLEKGSSATSASLKEALAEGDGEEAFAAILFTEAGKESPILRVLASVVRGKVSTVQAHLPKGSTAPDDEDVANDEGVAGMLKGIVDIPGTIPSVPFLVLLNKESGEGSVYGGAVDDAKAMLAFVRDGAGISATGTGGGGGSGGATGSEGGGDGKAMGGVLEIDPELLSALEEKGTEALVVAFVEGGEGDVDSIPGWTEATKGLQGEIRAGVLDCTAHPDQCDGSAKQKAPFVKVYPHGKGVDGDKRRFPSVLPASKLKEAVAEAEASLPEVVTVIPAGVGTPRIQDAVHSFLGANIFS
ncbi:unnamed protein product, partial [Ectocarpus fasciculatus]